MMQSRYLPDLEGWVFSVKTFGAAMLALGIALAVGLERPYWAMATVYIVAHKLTGAVRSKGMYRLVGTLVGAVATIVMVPNLANAPEVLTFCLALWIGLCLYVSVLDGTPRSYAFMLAGYTAAIIGFPVVSAPDTVWDVSVSRLEEIWLGIACATVVSTLVLPRPVAPVLRARLVEWRTNGKRLVLDAVTDTGEADSALDADIGRTRLRLAADAVEIRTLTAHLAYDTSALHTATPLMAAMEQRLLILLPVVAAVRDRIRDLRAVGGLTPGVHALLARLRGWIEADPDVTPPVEVASLRDDIERLEAEAEDGRSWACMLRGTLLSRLTEMIDLRQDFLDLRRAILAPGGPGRMPKLAVRMAGAPRLHRDHGIAALRGFTASVTLIAASAFWISAGWPDGTQAAALAAIACCFTAAQDDPVPALYGLFLTVLLASLFTAIGQFAVLPGATNFEMLSIAMAAFFIPAGMLGVIPATQKLAGLPIFTATLMALQENYNANFADWANGTCAALLGVAFAVVISAILVPAAAAVALRRRLRAGWADLADAARGRTHGQRLQLAEKFLDRMGLVAPLLAVSAAGEQMAAVAAMEDVRVGINLVDLNALRHDMPPALGEAVDGLLREAADHYARRAARDQAVPPPEHLLAAIDRALDCVCDMTGRVARGAVRALVGLRRTLFPAAPDYSPPALADAPQAAAA